MISLEKMKPLATHSFNILLHYLIFRNKRNDHPAKFFKICYIFGIWKRWFFLYLIWCYIDFILIALINAIFTNLSTIIFDVKSPHFLIMYRTFMES